MSAWDESRHRLGVADMDATHQAFLEHVAALLSASDEDFPACFLALEEHTRQHFEHEKQLMRRYAFAARGEHESEHLRVLGELRHFGLSVKRGRLAPARAYAAHLGPWFDQHLSTMDAALAGCIKNHSAAQ